MLKFWGNYVSVLKCLRVSKWVPPCLTKHVFVLYTHVLKGEQSLMTGWWVSLTMSLDVDFETFMIRGLAHTAKDGQSLHWASPWTWKFASSFKS